MTTLLSHKKTLFLLFAVFTLILNINSANAQCSADFSARVRSGCAPLTVQFTDESTTNEGILTWSWTFTNMETSTQLTSTSQNPQMTFTEAGPYNVTLSITCYDGTDSITKNSYITVSSCPCKARFKAVPTQGCVPLQVQFTDQSDGATSWNWSFRNEGGDETFATDQNPLITLSLTGWYRVTLTIGCDNSKSDVKVKDNYIYVEDCACAADFSASDTIGCAPMTVTFTDNSPGAVSWAWKFYGGNPSVASGQGPHVVTYNTPGQFDAFLKITCETGAVDSTYKSDYINVDDCGGECNAAFHASDTIGCAPMTVTFTDDSQGAVAWNWSFPGGSPSTASGQGPHVVNYSTPGHYDVILDIECTGGSDIEQKERYIYVRDCGSECNADFHASDTIGCAPMTVTFTDDSQSAVNWTWTFFGGNPSTASGQGPHVVTYNAPGLYGVQLKITCETGEVDSTYKGNYIYARDCGGGCNADFHASDTLGCAPLTTTFTDDSQGAVSWLWKFPGGNPQTANTQGPHTVIYNTPGQYYAFLKITCETGQVDSTIKSNYIYVRDCGNDQFDFGDAPDPQYPTLLSNNGARHLIDPAMYMGSTVDPDPDGQPDGLSQGDDQNMAYPGTPYPPGDEDGVSMSPFIAPGQTVPVTIVVSAAGAVNAWIDFNLNGNWGDPGEHIIAAQPVNPGANSFNFIVPTGAFTGLTHARFRYSSSRSLSYTGEAPDGEVEDYAVEITEGEDGSITIIKDANPKDNTTFWICTQMNSGFFNVVCYPFMDPLNNTRTILNPSHVVDISEATIPGWNLTNITVTGDMDNGSTVDLANSRVIMDFDPGENIVVTFKNEKFGEGEYDFGDAPDPGYPTLIAANGARHTINPNMFLGSGIDPEPDGQPTPNADGDDKNALYPGIPYTPGDEEGVTMAPLMTPGSTVPVTIAVSGSGAVNAWIDFNINGSWGDPGEQIISAQPVNPGTNGFSFTVPAGAQTGTTYARFRYSTTRNLSYDGLAPDGEVEDYKVAIQSRGEGSLKIIKDATPKDDTPFWISLVYGICGGAAPYRDPSGNTAIISNAPAGTYQLGESVPAGWTLQDIVITGDADNGSVKNVGAGTADIDLDPGESITVVFKNIKGGDFEYDFGDAPDAPNAPQYPTLHSNGGAYHLILPNFHLGVSIDADSDGQPDAIAMGDDNDGSDDEDGVLITSPLVPGQLASLEVTASAAGILNAWFDYDQNINWTDADDHTLKNIPIVAGSNSLSFNVPPAAVPGPTFARFRFSRVQGLLSTGYGQEGEVEDYIVEITEDGPGRPIKWKQTPLLNEDPDMPFTPSFFGWDERSMFEDIIIADDWYCVSPRPVTGIRWWGSYVNWDSVRPPQNAPAAFHIGIWTDVPAGVDQPWSHPGELVWEREVPREMLEEHAIGDDFVPGRMDKPDTCFQYEYNIPEPEWFWQEGDSTIYWLSISAIYESFPDEYPWGWKTREHYFHDDAVRIFEPKAPTVGSTAIATEPMEHMWDMSFMLFTEEYFIEFDFGDAPNSRYPTLYKHNGAQHVIHPHVFLGSSVDAEYNGQSSPGALGDDTDGNNDDDGVVFVTGPQPGSPATVKIEASTAGFLNGWMDFNNNGNWFDPDEHVFADQLLSAGSNALIINIPANAASSGVFSRFRFSTEPGLHVFGLAIDGEVEDYFIDMRAVAVEENDGNGALPGEYMLMQNYPNPFNLSTEIRYDMPNDGFVRLAIYNLMGSELRLLVDAYQSAGHHMSHWDGRDENGDALASGIYLLTMSAGEYRAARKIIVLK